MKPKYLAEVSKMDYYAQNQQIFEKCQVIFNFNQIWHLLSFINLGNSKIAYCIFQKTFHVKYRRLFAFQTSKKYEF